MSKEKLEDGKPSVLAGSMGAMSYYSNGGSIPRSMQSYMEEHERNSGASGAAQNNSFRLEETPSSVAFINAGLNLLRYAKQEDDSDNESQNSNPTAISSFDAVQGDLEDLPEVLIQSEISALNAAGRVRVFTAEEVSALNAAEGFPYFRVAVNETYQPEGRTSFSNSAIPLQVGLEEDMFFGDLEEYTY